MQPGALRQSDARAIELAMDNFCRANPQSQLAAGALALVRELAAKK
jgi:hypothetical protein